MPLNFDYFKNNNNQMVDFVNKISQGDKSDLLGIQANDYLNKIKNMIDIKLEKEETDRIDSDFKDSLKEMIIIYNNQITEEYLTYLSYIYFALYNDTLAAYNELKEKNVEIDYFMLDKQFYNNIAGNPIEWDKYSKHQITILKNAYKYGFFNEMREIIEINPVFYIPGRIVIDSLMQHNFKEMVDTFDKKMLAQSDFDVFSAVTLLKDEELKQELINYLKDLYKINPDIDFSSRLYSDLEILQIVKEALSIETAAFLKASNKYDIYDLISGKNASKNLKIELIKYYYSILEINPDYDFGYHCRDLLKEIIFRKITIPPTIFIKLTEYEMDEFYSELHYLSFRPDMKECIKINTSLKELLQKYSNPEEYKVLKKECKVKWRR